MAEEAESFQFTSASWFTDTLMLNLFHLWAIHGRGSRVLPYVTSASRFIDTEVHGGTLHLRQLMAEEAESFHVSICLMSTRHQFSCQANSEEAESFQNKAHYNENWTYNYAQSAELVLLHIIIILCYILSCIDTVSYALCGNTHRVLSNDMISHSAEYVAVEAESFHLLPHTARRSYVIPIISQWTCPVVHQLPITRFYDNNYVWPYN